MCHLLRLPAELRNEVYAHVAQNAPVQPLARPKIPVIAQVSRQIREEVLPIFFAEGHFSIDTVTNATLSGESERKVAGTLGLKRKVQSWLCKLGGVASIRNVTFQVYAGTEVRVGREGSIWSNYHLVTRLSLTADTHNIVVKRLSGGIYPPSEQLAMSKAFEDLCEGFNATAERIGGRDSMA